VSQRRRRRVTAHTAQGTADSSRRKAPAATRPRWSAPCAGAAWCRSPPPAPCPTQVSVLRDEGAADARRARGA
jgi:hypothetical protein